MLGTISLTALLTMISSPLSCFNFRSSFIHITISTIYLFARISWFFMPANPHLLFVINYSLCEINTYEPRDTQKSKGNTF